jgi:CRISPR-associated protein Cas2
MGHCLVVYDIVHDRTRTKIADICLDYGLDRIQYSAFVGKLVRTHQEELMCKLKRQLGKKAGNIQLYPICQKDWAERRVIDVAKGEDADGGTREEHDMEVSEPDEDALPF